LETAAWVATRDIVVGKRYRKKLGDLDSLAESMDRIGLLHPIGVDSDHRLIWGRRRLAAAQILGWEEIHAVVVDLDDGADAEIDENEIREDFRPFEKKAIAEALAARVEERRGGDHSKVDDRPLCPAPADGELTDDWAARYVGLGGRKDLDRLDRIEESGSPDLVEAVDESMIAFTPAAEVAEYPLDRQGRVVELLHEGVNAPSAIRQERSEFNKRQREEIAQRQADPPQGEFNVIVIDPPWPMEKIERDVAPKQVGFEYPTMTEEELADLNIPLAEDCHVWLWTTQKFLPMALRLLEDWGLKYVCTFTWCKPGGFQPFGLPQYDSEFALYARNGSPIFESIKDFGLWFEAPRGKHSEKPEAFYDMVRRVTTGQRLDMFNRREIEGFAGWGNES
jgi:N6-adenosine-specific RNA methylase IME4